MEGRNCIRNDDVVSSLWGSLNLLVLDSVRFNTEFLWWNLESVYTCWSLSTWRVSGGTWCSIHVPSSPCQHLFITVIISLSSSPFSLIIIFGLARVYHHIFISFLRWEWWILVHVFTLIFVLIVICKNIANSLTWIMKLWIKLSFYTTFYTT